MLYHQFIQTTKKQHTLQLLKLLDISRCLEESREAGVDVILVFDIMIRSIQKDYDANRQECEGDELFEISIEIHDKITDFL